MRNVRPGPGSSPGARSRPGEDWPTPGSQRKHEAIAGAALTLFVRDGYERTSVDAIAAEAAVSKRTVYSHYGDKENLFLSVVRETYLALRELTREVVDRTLRDVHDAEDSLTVCVREIARLMTQTPDRNALLRLIITEAPHFPALLDLWRGRPTISYFLASALDRMAAAGHLDIGGDPTLAAEHLTALTFGQINNRSLMGTIPLSDAEVERFITGGVRAFLRAYGIAP